MAQSQSPAPLPGINLPLVDPSNGVTSTQWYAFLQSLYIRQIGPSIVVAAPNTTSFTAAPVQINTGDWNNSGAWNMSVLDLTGTLGGAATVTLPSVQQVIAILPNAPVTRSYSLNTPAKDRVTTWTLRIINNSSANFAWTLAADPGATWTITGTATIAQHTYRDFLMSIPNTTTVGTTGTVQNIGSGTN